MIPIKNTIFLFRRQEYFSALHDKQQADIIKTDSYDEPTTNQKERE
jgi:hypothetical protein